MDIGPRRGGYQATGGYGGTGGYGSLIGGALVVASWMAGGVSAAGDWWTAETEDGACWSFPVVGWPRTTYQARFKQLNRKRHIR
jgi:hypothetical protein